MAYIKKKRAKEYDKSFQKKNIQGDEETCSHKLADKGELKKTKAVKDVTIGQRRIDWLMT